MAKVEKVRSRIKQLQLEQDSGKSIYDGRESHIDLNRAGTPLMELVFDPDLRSADQAVALLKELILILTRLQTCTCKMESEFDFFVLPNLACQVINNDSNCEIRFLEHVTF